MAGRPERIDHRSLLSQRNQALGRGDTDAAKKLDRDLDIHHGRSAWMEAKGQAAERSE